MEKRLLPWQKEGMIGAILGGRPVITKPWTRPAWEPRRNSFAALADLFVHVNLSIAVFIVHILEERSNCRRSVFVAELLLNILAKSSSGVVVIGGADEDLSLLEHETLHNGVDRHTVDVHKNGRNEVGDNEEELES